MRKIITRKCYIQSARKGCNEKQDKKYISMGL